MLLAALNYFSKLSRNFVGSPLLRKGSKTNERGFTLMELPGCGFYNGILAAVALPNFIAIQDKAREAAVMEFVKVVLE